MPDSALTVVSLIRDSDLQAAVGRWFDGQQRYRLVRSEPHVELSVALEQLGDSCDALLLQQGLLAPEAAQDLQERGLLWPAVVIGRVVGRVDYHKDEVHLPPDQLEQLTYSLDAAISRSLSRGLARQPGGPAMAAGSGGMPERWRLANRLQGRLGLLGVFYKRDPSRFLRTLPEREAGELVASLERTYRDLLLSYFKDPAAANQALESFVNTAFFSDLPITKTVEIHMNLIDSFAKQLSLEGHKSSFLQDYRLALLDVMAHLCEMYRRSIPTGQAAAEPGEGSVEAP
ncbi:MAG: circadian clock protein KaiA [Cyanobacteria bacterium]|nr:circadian clock protein KaiA [Cyanobacteriota bacterium]